MAWLGIGKLQELWGVIARFLPLAVPENSMQLILTSLPYIFKLFISGISSLSALLIGALWFFTGIMDAVDSLTRKTEPAQLKSPGLVAESLKDSRVHSWDSPPALVRILSWLWPRFRYISPVSYEVFHDAFRSFFKIAFLGVVIFFVFFLLRLAPTLVTGVLKREFHMVVPSPGLLYWLLAGVVGVNVVIAVSLVPFRDPSFDRTSFGLGLRGGGDPGAFFALLEEGCRLLARPGQAPRPPMRLKRAGPPQARGTLVESMIGPETALARPVAFFCMPLMVLLLISGFYKLINFQGPTVAMPHTEFFSEYALDYLLQVAFCLGLILCGVYFSEWARKLLGVRTFRSLVVFCQSVGGVVPEKQEDADAGFRDHEKLDQDDRWTVEEGVDEKFAAWARDPSVETTFSVDIFWAEVISESAGRDRHMKRAVRSLHMDKGMARILELPFHVDFEREEEEADSEDQAAAESGEKTKNLGSAN